MKKICIMGIVAGVILMIIGFYFMTIGFEGFSSGYVSSKVYGGDFYTDIYEAVKIIEEDVGELGQVVTGFNLGFGITFIFAGLFFIILFSNKMSEIKLRDKYETESISLLKEISYAMKANNGNSTNDFKMYDDELPDL